MNDAILRRRDRTAQPPRVAHYSSAVNKHPVSLPLIPSDAETLEDIQLTTRRDDLELSYGATAKARENAVKQDREQTTNAIDITQEGPDFCAGWNL